MQQLIHKAGLIFTIYGLNRDSKHFINMHRHGKGESRYKNRLFYL